MVLILDLVIIPEIVMLLVNLLYHYHLILMSIDYAINDEIECIY